jgi:hypothetical protein
MILAEYEDKITSIPAFGGDASDCQRTQERAAEGVGPYDLTLYLCAL